MRKIALSLMAMGALSTQMYAGGHIEPVEIEVQETVVEEMAESPFYIVVKGMTIVGDTTNHGEAVLDGDQDYGYGIDLGYRIGNGFAIEYDFSYSTNTVKERVGEDVEEGTGKYYTSALDLVYTYEVAEGFGVFGKVGYEYESETINAFEIDGSDHGFVFGAGVEIAMAESVKFVAEYEHSTIKGPRGDGILAGIMYSF